MGSSESGLLTAELSKVEGNGKGREGNNDTEGKADVLHAAK